MAARFWVGGTGTWDASDTSHWSGTSGGSSGSSVPVAADTVTFDGHASGLNGGTCTVSHASLSISTLTLSAMIGTLTFATNNNNITLGGTNATLTVSGTSTRTFNMGSGTWTFTGANPIIDFTTTTNLTFTGSNATIIFSTGTASSSRSFLGGGQTYGTLTLPSSNGSATAITGANTFTVVNIDNYQAVTFPGPGTITIGTLNITGAAATPCLLHSNSSSTASCVLTTGNLVGAAFRMMAFTGAPTATDSVDLGGNSGITITPPAGGGRGKVYGG